MDNGSVIIGGIILLIFVVPIVWVIYNSNRKSKERKKLVKDLCRDNGINVENTLQIGNALLGMDYQNKKMFHTSLQNIENDFKVIPIDSVVSLHVLEENYTGRNIIESVVIQITTDSEKYQIIVYDDKAENQVVTDAKTCYHEANQWVEQVKPKLL